MRILVARLIAVCVVTLAAAGLMPERGDAASFSALESAVRSTAALDQTPLVHKVHGFHCRKMLGWDAVAGVYHLHSHPGICANYKRCIRAQKRCVFLRGGGFQDWSYELFGSENDRFTRCMIRAGCY